MTTHPLELPAKRRPLCTHGRNRLVAAALTAVMTFAVANHADAQVVTLLDNETFVFPNAVTPSPMIDTIGIFANSGNDITVLSTGTIDTFLFGILTGDNNSITNNGNILSDFGVDVGNGNTVINNQLIDAGEAILGQNGNVITNNGNLVATIARNGGVADTTAGIVVVDHNTVTNNVTITSEFNGIVAEDFNTITNNATGVIDALNNGIQVTDNNTIVNNGFISAVVIGIQAGNGNSITNDNGTIDTAILGIFALNGNTIINNTVIDATTFGILVGDGNNVTNNGNLLSGLFGIDVGSGNTVINNSTIATGDNGINAVSGNSIINNGSIGAGNKGIELSGDNNTIVNNSDIIGLIGIALTGAGSNSVKNYGTLTGDSGVAIDAATFGTGSENIFNAGRINGDLLLGPGADTVVNGAGGRIFGEILLGDGDDSLQLSETSTVSIMGSADGGLGIDTLTLGGQELASSVEKQFISFEILYVDGNVIGDVGDVMVNPSGSPFSILGGFGRITGNVVNNGIVAPGRVTVPGILTVTGNYAQSPGGTLSIDIGGRNSGDFDVLAVGGGASLGGHLQLVQLNNFKLMRSDKLAFLTSGAGISGRFSDVEGLDAFGNPGTILEPVILYKDNTFYLAAQAVGTFSDFALTPNQKAVAGMLDGVVSDPRESKLIGYLDLLNTKDLAKAYDLIAPAALSSLFSAGIAANNIQAANLDRRMEEVRAGITGFSASNLTLAIYGKGPSDGKSTYDKGGPGKETKEMIPPPPEECRWGVFVSGMGEFVFVDGDFQTDSFDITTAGFTIGADYKVNNHFALGLYAGYANTDVDLTGGGKVGVNSGKGGIYATVFGDGAYVNVAAGGGYNSYDTKRQALQGNASGDTDGGEFNSLLALGYDWHQGGLTAGPVASLQYTYVGIDGFTESGSLAPLSIDSQDANSLRTRLGGRMSYEANVSGIKVTPELRAAWQHEYLDDAYSVSSRLATGAGNGFTVDGPSIGRDSLILGAGMTVQWRERLAVFVNYDAQLASENFSYHSVTGGFRLCF